MKPLAALVLTLFANSASASEAVIDACRKAHAEDPAAHVACLEEALRGQATAAPASSPKAASPAPAPPAAPEKAIGARDVETRKGAQSAEPATAQVEIVQARYGSDERGVFQLADGQRWREVEVSPRQFRLQGDRHYQARIERTKLGGYRLYVDGIRRMLKVERLE
jgi:hypothetical protein